MIHKISKIYFVMNFRRKKKISPVNFSSQPELSWPSQPNSIGYSEKSNRPELQLHSRVGKEREIQINKKVTKEFCMYHEWHIIKKEREQNFRIQSNKNTMEWKTNLNYENTLRWKIDRYLITLPHSECRNRIRMW